MKRQRLDAELVRRQLARSRQQAAELIAQGAVTVNGVVASKPATQVDLASALEVNLPAEQQYVSRGAYKLLGALNAVPSLDVSNLRCLDAGASTGGFTQVLLERGAAHVTAVDVGYGQLAWSLQQDPRVTVLDRTNIRHLTADQIQPPPDVVVGDLSFISLTLVMKALVEVASPTAQFLLMVKPQFEIGKDRLGASGVVRSPQLRAETIRNVAHCAIDLGLAVGTVAASPLPGPAGNVEYFVHLHRGSHGQSLAGEALTSVITEAVAKGPRGRRDELPASAVADAHAVNEHPASEHTAVAGTEREEKR